MLQAFGERRVVVAEQLGQVLFVRFSDGFKAHLRAGGEPAAERVRSQSEFFVNQQINEAARHAGAEPGTWVAEHEAAPRSHVLEGEALDVGARGDVSEFVA